MPSFERDLHHLLYPIVNGHCARRNLGIEIQKSTPKTEVQLQFLINRLQLIRVANLLVLMLFVGTLLMGYLALHSNKQLSETINKTQLLASNRESHVQQIEVYLAKIFLLEREFFSLELNKDRQRRMGTMNELLKDINVRFLGLEHLLRNTSALAKLNYLQVSLVEWQMEHSEWTADFERGNTEKANFQYAERSPIFQASIFQAARDLSDLMKDYQRRDRSGLQRQAQRMGLTLQYSWGLSIFIVIIVAWALRSLFSASSEYIRNIQNQVSELSWQVTALNKSLKDHKGFQKLLEQGGALASAMHELRISSALFAKYFEYRNQNKKLFSVDLKKLIHPDIASLQESMPKNVSTTLLKLSPISSNPHPSLSGDGARDRRKASGD